VSKDLPTTDTKGCVDYKQLSKTGLDSCLDELLAQPASNQQASELQHLLHELQVHQIELEIQNRELRESQQLLEEARDRYADLYDFAPVGYLTLDDKGSILDINLRGAAMLGRERSRLIGVPLVPFLAPGESPGWFAHLAQVFKTSSKQMHELRLKPVDGKSCVVLIQSVVVGGGEDAVYSCHSAIVNITQQRQMEDELKQSEARLRVIFDQAAVGVAVLDSNSGIFQKINKKFSDIIGYSADEMLSLGFMQITHPDDLQKTLDNMHKLKAGEIREYSQEKRIYHKNGAIIWVNVTVSPMWSVADRPDFHISIIEDISQRKQAEIVLEAHNEVLELMAHGASLDKVLTSLVCMTEEVYPNMLCAILKQQGDELMLSSTTPALAELFHGANGKMTIDHESGCYVAAALTGQRLLIEDIMTHPNCVVCREAAKKTGVTSCWLEPVISSTGEVLGVFTAFSRHNFTPTSEDLKFIHGSARLAGIAIERDLIEDQTHQRQAELAHMARLNMMGEMATGMAHELNQPLTAIATYADVALRLLDSDIKQPGLLEEALQGARQQAVRASEIIRHLRQLVRKQAPQKVDVDINMLIRDVVEFVQFEVRKYDIQFTLKLDKALPKTSVDSIQIEQVLLNLVRNSIEALQLVTDIKREVTIHTGLNRDGWLQVEIADNGPGMNAEILDRLFKPFVTTKGASGMGMGLSICHSIIEAHGGRLWAESEPGQGARFFLTLPLNAQSTQE